MTDSTRSAQGWVPDTSTFGARLALVRQRMGWTNIKEAAEACAIAVESWRRWEAGKTEPRSLISACMKIAGVTGVNYGWLALGPINEMPAPARAETVPAAFTQKYVGERVVAVIGEKPDQAIDSLLPSGMGRTRPINRHPSRQLVGQGGR